MCKMEDSIKAIGVSFTHKMIRQKFIVRMVQEQIIMSEMTETWERLCHYFKDP